MTARTTKSLLSITRSPGAVLAVSLATACQPFDFSQPPENIPLHLERTGDELRFSWEGDKLHRFEVVQCDEPARPDLQHCVCNGSLVWVLGAGETAEYHEVALEQPFLASPLQYGMTPESDRRGYGARTLVTGRTYIASARRVGLCEENPEGCQQTTALGCQRFVW